MPFNRHIYDLLLENEVVIIPEFGAFVTSVIPSRTDIVTGSLLPPSKVIRFDPKIRNNDWLLAGHIAESEGITDHEALKKIRKICDEVLYRLDNGEHVIFEKTGLLYFDNNKELCFEQDKEAALHLDAYGFDPVPIIPAAETQDEQKPVPELKHKSNNLWLLLIIPVAVGAFFIFRNLNKPATKPEQEKIQTPQENILQDSLPGKDSISPEETAQKEIPSEVIQSNEDTLQGKKYYVIGGSFENEDNARMYIAKMETKGFKPILTEKKGRFFIVALGVFNDLKEAGEFRSRLEEEFNDPGIWILPY